MSVFGATKPIYPEKKYEISSSEDNYSSSILDTR